MANGRNKLIIDGETFNRADIIAQIEKFIKEADDVVIPWSQSSIQSKLDVKNIPIETTITKANGEEITSTQMVSPRELYDEAKEALLAIANIMRENENPKNTYENYIRTVTEHRTGQSLDLYFEASFQGKKCQINFELTRNIASLVEQLGVSPTEDLQADADGRARKTGRFEEDNDDELAVVGHNGSESSGEEDESELNFEAVNDRESSDEENKPNSHDHSVTDSHASTFHTQNTPQEQPEPRIRRRSPSPSSSEED